MKDPKLDELDRLMQDGYELLESRKEAAACDIWLKAWERVKEIATPEMQTTSDFDRKYQLTQFLFNWCQDLEMELGNAGREDQSYNDRRLQYCREFLGDGAQQN